MQQPGTVYSVGGYIIRTGIEREAQRALSALEPVQGSAETLKKIDKLCRGSYVCARQNGVMHALGYFSLEKDARVRDLIVCWLYENTLENFTDYEAQDAKEKVASGTVLFKLANCLCGLSTRDYRYASMRFFRCLCVLQRYAKLLAQTNESRVGGQALGGETPTQINCGQTTSLDLIRHDLLPVTIGKYPRHNAGLSYSRYLTKAGDIAALDSLLQYLLQQSTDSSAYTLAYSRCEELIRLRSCVSFTLQCERMMLGNSEPHAAQTNLRFRYPYGVPMIDGWALKGLARSVWRSTQEAGEARYSQVERELFGEVGAGTEASCSGTMVFDDAWIVPTARSPYLLDVVTPHHTNYHSNQGSRFPADDEDPIPVRQIAVAGEFLFALDGPANYIELTRQLLTTGLCNKGIGAKKKLNYGVFLEDGGIVQATGTSDGSARQNTAIDDLLRMNKQQVVSHLGQPLEDLQNLYGDHWPKLANILSKDHPALTRGQLKSWKNQGGIWTTAHQRLFGDK